jgi:hypothetical protein
MFGTMLVNKCQLALAGTQALKRIANYFPNGIPSLLPHHLLVCMVLKVLYLEDGTAEKLLDTVLQMPI